MTHQNDHSRPVRVVFQKSRVLTKVVVLVALVLSMAALATLIVTTTEAKARSAELAQQAAQLEQENANLEQHIDDLNTIQGIESIAKEELGLVDPDTVVFNPES